MDLSKTLKWRDGNGNGNVNANANADAKVTTIALPVLCTGELKSRILQNMAQLSLKFLSTY